MQTNIEVGYYSECKLIIRKFFAFSKLELVSKILERDKRLGVRNVTYLVDDFRNDLDISVEVLRSILCNLLNLESVEGYVAFKILVELGSEYMSDSVSFCKDASKEEKQGILQACMQMISLAKKGVLEVNAGKR